jgi:hypothetical protein
MLHLWKDMTGLLSLAGSSAIINDHQASQPAKARLIGGGQGSWWHVASGAGDPEFAARGLFTHRNAFHPTA